MRRHDKIFEVVAHLNQVFGSGIKSVTVDQNVYQELCEIAYLRSLDSNFLVCEDLKFFGIEFKKEVSNGHTKTIDSPNSD